MADPGSPTVTTTLMTYAGPVDDHALVTRTGGVPLVPAGFTWPRCAACSRSMQFLAQLLVNAPGTQEAEAAAVAECVLSVFMCQNDPGLCDEWDPVAGGNRGLLFPRAGLTPAPVSTKGETLLSETCDIDCTAIDAAPTTRHAVTGRRLTAVPYGTSSAVGGHVIPHDLHDQRHVIPHPRGHDSPPGR